MSRSAFGAPGREVPVQVHATATALGEELARRILDGVAAAGERGRRYLLGCPGGRSLKSTFDALGRRAQAAGADLRHVVIVMMDEYVLGRAGAFVPCSAAAHYSCRGFAEREIRAPVNAGLDGTRRIPRDHVWVADPADPGAYERLLETSGGIDLFLLASGATDGHVAFNPPGTLLGSTTRVIEIAEATRRDNMSTFPAFRSLDEVPTHGVSVGLGTIASHSREVALVIHGAHKAAAVRRLAACDDFTPAWPASVIYRCRTPSILLDAAAAAEEGSP